MNLALNFTLDFLFGKKPGTFGHLPIIKINDIGKTRGRQHHLKSPHHGLTSNLWTWTREVMLEKENVFCWEFITMSIKQVSMIFA